MLLRDNCPILRAVYASGSLRRPALQGAVELSWNVTCMYSFCQAWICLVRSAC